jgi:hypothetical protein
VKSLPVIAGVLVLGVALFLVWTNLRTTRTHDHRPSGGAPEFAIEVPRSWPAKESSSGSHIVNLEGPLPSGRQGYLSLQRFQHSIPRQYFSDEPLTRKETNGVAVETWSEGGWTRRVERSILPMGPGTGKSWMINGIMQRGDLTFTVMAALPEESTGADRALLESCVRSMRWVGR